MARTRQPVGKKAPRQHAGKSISKANSRRKKQMQVATQTTARKTRRLNITEEILSEGGPLASGNSIGQRGSERLPSLHVKPRSDGVVRRVDNTTAVYHKQVSAVTAIPCPCEDASCMKLIRVGVHAAMGSGSQACVHCGSTRSNERGEDGFFKSKSDLVIHLNTRGCKASRGIRTNTKTPIAQLGRETTHLINNPKYEVLRGSSKYFKCPVCTKEITYGNRYNHAIPCFPTTGVSLTDIRSFLKKN